MNFFKTTLIGGLIFLVPVVVVGVIVVKAIGCISSATDQLDVNSTNCLGDSCRQARI